MLHLLRIFAQGDATMAEFFGKLPDVAELIGLAASFLTTAAFFPQAVRTIYRRDTRGLSLVTYLLMTLGVATWLTYGLLIGNRPITIANGVTLIPIAAILIMKLRLG